MTTVITDIKQIIGWWERYKALIICAVLKFQLKNTHFLGASRILWAALRCWDRSLKLLQYYLWEFIPGTSFRGRFMMDFCLDWWYLYFNKPNLEMTWNDTRDKIWLHRYLVSYTHHTRLNVYLWHREKGWLFRLRKLGITQTLKSTTHFSKCCLKFKIVWNFIVL